MPTRAAVLLLILIPAITNAQRAGFSFRNININQGLSQSSVVDIAIDNIGLPWFATQDGLNRYDGKEFQVYQKSFDDVTGSTYSRLGKLAVSADNKLFMITSGGKLEIMNLYNNTIQPARLPDSLQPTALLIDNSNRILVGTALNGVYILDNKFKISQHLDHHTGMEGSVLSFFRDRAKRIWVLTDKGVFRLMGNGKRAQRFSLQGTAGTVPAGTIDEDAAGTMWLGTYGRGLFFKNRNDNVFRPAQLLTTGQPLPGDLKVETVLCDQRGRKWIGTYGNGLFIIDSNNSHVLQLRHNKNDPHSIGFNDVLCIKQDQFGGIWLGTDGGGISYYDERLNNFSLLSNANLPDDVSIDQIRSISVSNDGTVWAGTSNNGLSYIDKSKQESGTLHFSPFASGVDNYDRVVALEMGTNGQLWAGTQGNGIFIIDPVARRIVRRMHPGSVDGSFIDNTAWCLRNDIDGNMWIGTATNGLCKITPAGNSTYYKRNKSLIAADENIRVILPLSDSILCIGYEKSGIALFNRLSGTFSFSPALHNQALNNIIIKSLHYAGSTLWIGTGGQGLYAVDLISGRLDIITDRKGLPNNIIYGILPDDEGALWLSTNKGICRYAPPASIPSTNHSNFQLYTADDGLQSNEFNTGAFYRSGDGTLYFGGINGISYFNPQSFINSQPHFPIILTHITVDNEPLIGDTTVAFRKHLRLDHDDAAISFSFAGLNFASPGRLNYFYQLQGYDEEWIDAGSRNYAAYTNLRAGNYTFLVKASLDANDAGTSIKSITVSIPLPFWKTWWFIGSCILAMIGILYLLYRARIAQLLRLQKVRNRIATDLHDDIGSTLTNISILSELSRKNAEVKPEGQLFLDRISEEVTNSSQALDDIVWSINSKNDSLAETVARMRRYAAEIFEAAGVTYTLNFDEKFSDRKLEMEQRRDVFLLFKESVNNIYKHAKATEVAISIDIDRNTLLMSIADNGLGFDSQQTTHRNGLKNLHQRTEKWKGTADIVAAPGSGTRIVFTVPLA